MRNAKKKQSQPKKRHSIILRLVLICFIAYGITQLSILQIQLISEKKTKAQMESENKALQLKISQLETILQTGNESDFIERAARERLGYVYSDEEIWIDTSGK